MMTDPLDLLVPMLIFLILGIIGITFWLAWTFFKLRYKDRLKNPAASTVTSVPSTPYLLGLQHTADGTWKVEVQGESYATLEAVPDDAVRQEVVAGLKELVAFARSYVQQQSAQKGSRPEPPRQAATSPSLQEPAPPRTTPVTPPPPEPTSTPPAGPVVQDKLRVMLKGEPPLKRSAAMPTLLPTIDLAHEIGEIVARMQAQNPALVQRSIRLQNALSGGIQFAIDCIVYATVEEIPDPAIQALIRAATKEWERR